MKLLCVALMLLALTACGGGSSSGGSNSGGSGGSTADVTAPSGYTVVSFTNPITDDNQTQVSFQFSQGEVGATYAYDITDDASGLVSGTGSVTSSSQTVSGIDVSGLVDGNIQLSLTLEDDSGNQGAAVTETSTKVTTAAEDSVTISGSVTFDRVPISSTSYSLTYTATSVEPARGVTVQALSSSGEQLASTTTDSLGAYALVVDANTQVRIQVLSEMVKTGDGANWDISVVDNTAGNALYGLQGSLGSSGSANSTRNLLAGSGWGGSSYSGSRAAAPFAILDSFYEVLLKLQEYDAEIQLPELMAGWSVNNIPASGDVSDGEIGTSSYDPNAQMLFILGAEDNDTDEYDMHVIVHEFGHYLEDRLTRTETIGGSHSSADRLDARVAMSEGWGNALSGIVLDDPLYRDSFGAQQSNGFSVNVESNTLGHAGWYSEASVQSLLYDFYDSNDDGADTLSLGAAPIFEALFSEEYQALPSLTTIFSFIEVFKANQLDSSAAIDALLAAQDIDGVDQYGTGETNDAGVASTLPVYAEVQVGGAPVEVCSTKTFSESNKLGNYRYLRFSITESGVYTISMTRSSGETETDPDIYLFNRGELESVGYSADTNQETLAVTLTADAGAGSTEFALAVTDYFNSDGSLSTGGTSCFEVSVTQ